MKGIVVVIAATVRTAVVIVIIVVIVVVVVVMVAGLFVLADAVLASRGDVGNVKALVGAEALDLELVLLSVIVVGQVDVTGALKVRNGAADVAALLGRVAEVKVDAVGASHEDEGRRGQENALDMHVGGVVVLVTVVVVCLVKFPCVVMITN